jgi:chemotaxis protein MotB
VPKSAPEEEPQSAPEWLVTFSDMTGLLVTFFIMLMTFSSSEKERYAKMAGSLAGQFGAIADPKTLNAESLLAPPPNIRNRVVEDGLRRAREDLSLVQEQLTTLVRRQGVGNRIDFDQVVEGRRISISCSTPFSSQSAQLTSEIRETLREVADLMRVHPHRVLVVGHAWKEGAANRDETLQISAERALAAAEYLTTAGRLPTSRVMVAARGELAPREKGAGESAIEHNRRIEIVVLPPEE